MNKLTEMFTIIIGVVLTLGLTMFLGFFHGWIQIFELALTGISLIRVFMLMFSKK